MRIPFLKKDGYEADDIIATLVTQALADGSGIDDVLILTGDRDSIQLVTDRSTVLYPMRGVSDLARMTPAYVQDRYGIPPERYPELAALVGETSDNLPGVPGVGQGYAAKWINQYDGLDNVITHADEITGKKGESLREHLADVIRRYDLTRWSPISSSRPVRPTWPGRAMTGRPCTRSSTGSSSPCSAPGCSRRCPPRRRRRSTTPASTSRCGCSTPVSCPGGSPTTRRGPVVCRAGSASTRSATGRPARRPPRSGVRHRGGCRLRHHRQARRRRRGGAGRVAQGRLQAEGPPRRQGTDAGVRRARDAAGGARARYRAVGVPRPARPALLRPGRPDRPLPQARAAAGAGRRRPAQPGGSRR